MCLRRCQCPIHCGTGRTPFFQVDLYPTCYPSPTLTNTGLNDIYWYRVLVEGPLSETCFSLGSMDELLAWYEIFTNNGTRPVVDHVYRPLVLARKKPRQTTPSWQFFGPRYNVGVKKITRAQYYSKKHMSISQAEI